MRRLTKELTKAGILFETDEIEITLHGAIDACSRLVEVTQDFIITAVYSQVMPTELHLFDRKTWELVAVQNLFPEWTFANAETNRTSRTWGSYCLFDRKEERA